MLKTRRKRAAKLPRVAGVDKAAREAFNLALEKTPLPHLFTARTYQAECETAFRKGCRRFITVWPRGGGKDQWWMNFIAKRMAERVGTYYHIYPELRMGRRNLWDSTSNDGFRFLDHFPRALCRDDGRRGRNEAEMTVTYLNGSRYQVLGADEPDRLRGGNPIGVAFSEFAWTAKSAWPILQPRLIQNKGWVSFNSTPDGRDQALWPLWKSAIGGIPESEWEGSRVLGDWFLSLHTGKSIRKNGALWKYDPVTDSYGAHEENGETVYTDAQIEEFRREGRPEDWIAQEIFCSFSGARAGSYYGQQMVKARNEGRIGHGAALWDNRFGVSTVWDTGFTDHTSIWFFQKWAQRVSLVDYVQDAGKDIAHYAKVLRERPYRYNSHWGPHDLKQKNWQTGKSSFEVARDCGIYFNLVPEGISFMDGINAVRGILPRCFFEDPACAIGIEALERYRAIYNKKLDEQGTHPVHDKFSHGADAFRYLALIADMEQDGAVRKTFAASDGEFDVFAS